METDLTNTAGMFKTNTDIVNRALANVAPDDWFKNPGDDSNHLMWIMGHLVVHRGQTLKTLGVDWNSEWASLFARGTDRLADTAAYPSAEEMLTAWQQVSAELVDALQQPAADVLERDAPKGPPTFNGKVSGTVAFYAFHDTYHVGQISYLRKWLGYGKTIG
jgi:DinB superfamily